VKPVLHAQPTRRMSIGIAGAGLVGRLLAWRLAGLGHAVQVFDPAADAGPAPAGSVRAAGWTAAGMLSPIAELESADALTAARGWRSLDLWQDVVAQLPLPVDYRRAGSLMVAHRGDLGTAQRLLALLAAKCPAAQLPQALDADALRALEPALQNPGHAWLLPGEGQIHSVQAMTALAEGATQRGACWHWEHAVASVGARRLDAQRFDWVFDARGLGARPDLPLRGVRGEIVWVHAPGLALQRAVRLLHPRLRVYLVPRPGDIVVVGASEIESEDRSPVSVRSLLGLLSAAHSVLPELAEGRVVHTETNLRPALPDNLAVVQTQPGLTRINGLFRHGWLLAPALVEEALLAAQLVAPRQQAA
jgi:glycine oxidase